MGMLERIDVLIDRLEAGIKVSEVNGVQAFHDGPRRILELRDSRWRGRLLGSHNTPCSDSENHGDERNDDKNLFVH